MATFQALVHLKGLTRNLADTQALVWQLRANAGDLAESLNNRVEFAQKAHTRAEELVARTKREAFQILRAALTGSEAKATEALKGQIKGAIRDVFELGDDKDRERV